MKIVIEQHYKTLSVMGPVREEVARKYNFHILDEITSLNYSRLQCNVKENE